MAFPNYVFLFATILLHSYRLAIADSIQGCGGFVEASSALIKSRKSTDAKLDYSHVTVELRTLDGLVKDRTQCAPNGYYFIPVYDKGSYVIKIKGPEGWTCAPEQVPVVVDHTGCNANEDINFQFTGFTLSGRVVGASGNSCSHKTGGPSDVNVTLLSPSGDVVSSVSTTSTGSYSFKNITPGKYRLGASRRDLTIEVKGSEEVELGFDNGVVDDIFFASGYDIRGYVVAQGNPILGVHFYLYSDDVSEVNCPHDSGNAPGLGKALCLAISDADGMFEFTSIPCGTYKLVPFYKGENTVFDVSPPSMLVSVQHDHAIISQRFQVTGFSVGGRVIDSNGIGVDAAKIIVDGDERSVTDKEGYYKLDQVTSKRYSIEAKKDHYKFERLDNFLVLPNMASIIDIKAISYDICGMAQTVSSAYKAKVALTHGPDNVKPQVQQADENSNFCFEVPPGEYRLSAFAATADSAPELLFSPPYLDVIVNKPLLDVKFYQAQVNVRGLVVCKDKCGPPVSVMLVRLDGKGREKRRSINLTDQSSEFSFSNVLPGKYRVEVKNYSPGTSSGEDVWCWEQSFINVDVGVEDVEEITFIQKGYWVKVISSHDVDAYLVQADGSPVNLKIKKGSQQICVESPGVHDLHFIDSCISFGNSTLRVDTSDLSPINLKGEKYLLKGHINVESNEDLPENIPLDILDNETLVDGSIARRVPAEVDQSRTAVYEYSVWANFGENLIFVPWDSRTDEGKKLVFYPIQQHVLVAEDGCQASVAPFSGRLGLYLEGSVSPPLSHVQIRVLADGDSHISPLKQGDIALETITGEDGLFLAGPLYDDIGYSIEASKPGYYVKRVGQYSFSCQKLGQISVRLYSREDNNEPFPSVLLSLSGEDGYRNNSVTGVGGTFMFDNLFPGSFYLRPLLKEYAFSPPAEAIDLHSGESKEVVFHATRVAFSALGKVTLLSGQPKEGVSVEARAESQGFYEETITDSSGSYRLRGLQPDASYVIKIAKKGDLGGIQIERASPESLTVKVGYEDIKELDFVVFEQPDTTILSGHVEGKNIEELHSHIRVEIRSASERSKVESIFPLPISNFFQVKDLPKGKHLLQLRSAMPSSTHRFESEVIEVDLERQPQIHVGPLSYRIQEDVYKQELTPAPVYPLVVGVSVIALFISMPRLKDLYQALVARYMSGSSVTAKKDVKKLSVRKKTY
ncbi:Metalloproteinase-related collagenase pM5 [Handroanthus impetiginosus]|uniref:Metalloproteinase-related collagenase pM5 n=1 Tax=Handroanthus impetiginosus TaxID=429701 RepID=A0A2G9HDJ6_9LAMI|nr:Metalloproteinase-related collagenase pM5 [Handroanthus impetiginosus]